MMNVIFLDFDGVVNTLMWKDRKWGYGFPENGGVNNYQACQWISYFCKTHQCAVVISSTWRSDGMEECTQYLRNGGFWEEIPIIGITPKLDNGTRGDEIALWLEEHPEVEHFLIFDDDSDMDPYMDYLVKCNTYIGFTFVDFQLAEELVKQLWI